LIALNTLKFTRPLPKQLAVSIMSGEASWDNPSAGYADDRAGANGGGGGWGGGGRTPSPGRNDRRSRSPDRRPMEDDRRDDRGREPRRE